MGESQSGGGVDTDVGGAGLDTGGGRDTSPSYGQSPGAMGGRVPDVQPSIYGGSFDPGVYSQPVSSSVMAGNPSIPSLATNDAYQANQEFLSGIQSLTGGMSPGAMGGRNVDDSPSYSSRPDPSTAMPLRVDTQVKPRIRFNPVTNELLRDQTGNAVFGGDMGITRSEIAGEETGTERDVFRMLPINEPMGAGRIRPELEADPFAPLGGTGVSPDTVRSRRFDDTGIVGPIRTIDARQRPDPNEINMFARTTATQDFPPPGGSMPFGKMDSRDEVLDAAVGSDFFGEGTLGPLGTDEATTLANLVTTGKKGNQKQEAQKLGFIDYVKKLGKDISGLSFSDIVGAVGDFLRGDPNFKGKPSSAMDPFARQGMGPGPFVGGGVPSPSGPAAQSTGGMAKDPCPPGFRFDATLQQCVPIVAPAAPAPVAGTAPVAPTPATGGISNIPNAYPFTLTPPIGAPIGNIAPVRS